MRLHSGWVLSLLVLVACGDDSSTPTGGSGAGGGSVGGAGGQGAGSTGGGGAGTGGTSTGGNTSGGGGNGGTSTTGGGGAGGGDACVDACGKAAGCGVPQDQCMTFLDCSTEAGTCQAACVNDPSVDCTAIITALQTQQGALYECFVGCGSTGTGGAGGGGGGGTGGAGGGGSAAQCQQCAQTSCQSQYFQCVQQVGATECQAWLTCISTCADAACVDDCTTAHPGGAGMETCACTSCSTDCADLCN